MKKLICLIFLTTCVNIAFAQSSELPKNYDSLVRKVIKMDASINTMQNNMARSHQEFKNGTVLIISGIVLTALGAAAQKTKGHEAIIGIGVALGTIGWILQTDSHKFIGRGGRNKNKWQGD